MKKDLSKLGIDEVIKEIGLYLTKTDIMQCFKSEETMQELFNQFYDMKDFEIINFIKKHEKDFDMNRFIFANYLIMSGEKKLEGIDLRGKITNKDIKLRKMEEHLATHPVLLIDANPETMIGDVYDSRDYANQEQAQKHIDEINQANRRIEEIDKKVPFQYFLMVQILTDIEAIYCKDPRLGRNMRDSIVINTYKKDEEMTKAQLFKLLEEAEINERPFYEYIEPFTNELIKYSSYIDWDKFLILSAFRAKNTLESTRHEEYPEGNQEILISILEAAKELVENPKARIKGKIELKEGGEREVKYSFKDIEKDLEEKVIDGKYYGEAEIEKIKTELLTGKIKIEDIYSKRIIKLLNLNGKEKQECMNNNQSNAINLFRNGFLTERELKKFLSSAEIKKEIFNELVSLKKEDGTDLLTNQEILDLYLNGNIDLEIVSKADKIKTLLTEKELVKQYKKLEESSAEEKAKIERYFSIFREMRIRGSEQREGIGNNIILELGDNMEEKDFVELYKRNLIPIETIIDWNSEEFALEMFRNGLLKPTDSKELLNKGIISISRIKEGLLRGLNDYEKIALIITVFDEEWQESIRNELFQDLTVLEDDIYGIGSSPNPTYTKTDDDADKKEKSKRKKYEFDPCYKMKLLELIDKDYRARLTKDGHMIFELPNLGQVIIEKMFKKNINYKIINANDAATYILKLHTFYAGGIVTPDDKINRSYLYYLEKNNQAERYYHTENWGDTIKEVFDIAHSNRHTESDKKKIDEIIQRTKRTRRLRTI